MELFHISYLSHVKSYMTNYRPNMIIALVLQNNIQVNLETSQY